jgi:hypothetical protein
LSVIDTQTLLRLVFGAAGASAYLVLALVVLRAEGRGRCARRCSRRRRCRRLG